MKSRFVWFGDSASAGSRHGSVVLDKGAKAPFLTPAMVDKGGTWRPPDWPA